MRQVNQVLPLALQRLVVRIKFSIPLVSPEHPMHVEPQSEHRWLHKLVGEWTYVGDCNMGPD